MLPGQLYVRHSCKLERIAWLLSSGKQLRRFCEPCSSHHCHSICPAADHIYTEADRRTRRLLRYNYNGRTRTPKGCQWGLWYCSPCCRRNVPEVRWCSAQHNCGSTACSDRSPIPMRKAPCYTTSRYTYVVRTWINIQLAIMGSISSLRILFVVLGHIDHLWYGNSVEMTESLSGSQL